MANVEGKYGLLHTAHPEFTTEVTHQVDAPCPDGTHKWESIGPVHWSAFRCTRCFIEIKDHLSKYLPQEVKASA